MRTYAWASLAVASAAAMTITAADEPLLTASFDSIPTSTGSQRPRRAKRGTFKQIARKQIAASRKRRNRRRSR